MLQCDKLVNCKFCDSSIGESGSLTAVTLIHGREGMERATAMMEKGWLDLAQGHGMDNGGCRRDVDAGRPRLEVLEAYSERLAIWVAIGGPLAYWGDASKDGDEIFTNAQGHLGGCDN